MSVEPYVGPEQRIRSKFITGSIERSLLHARSSKKTLEASTALEASWASPIFPGLDHKTYQHAFGASKRPWACGPTLHGNQKCTTTRNTDYDCKETQSHQASKMKASNIATGPMLLSGRSLLWAAKKRAVIRRHIT